MKKILIAIGLLFFACSCDHNPINSSDISSSSQSSSYVPSPIIDPNEYIGEFNGYNVITIMVETGATIAINEVLTPNLYKLKHEGINFTNNYCKNKTNVSEFIGMAGSTPKAPDSLSSEQANQPFTLPNVLKNYGYTNRYFHCNSGSYYNRKDILKHVGFDITYFSNNVPGDFGWWLFDGNYPLDTEFYSAIETDLVPSNSKTPFYSFWSTLSMHGPYDFGNENIEKFEELGYFEKIDKALEDGAWKNLCSDDSDKCQNQFRHYQAATMNLDDALGKMLKRLEDTDQLDNTIIVLYGDHDVYYDVALFKDPLSSYIYNNDSEYYSPKYETMLMIYNPKISTLTKELFEVEEYIYRDFTSPYVIVPTLLDMLGISYNEDDYVGKSIFKTTSKFANIFYSHELDGYMTENFFMTSNNKFKYSNADDKQEFKSKVEDLSERINYFNELYTK